MSRTTFTEEIMDTMMGAILNTHIYTFTHIDTHTHSLRYTPTDTHTNTRISDDQVNHLLILNSKVTRCSVGKALW